MTDASRTGGALPPFPDDDRLLAYVLGLQADPTLEAAAVEDDVLRRLEALRAEMARIAEQVARAVPEPDETYTDLAQPRWASLRPHLERETHAAVQARSRSRASAKHWLRILAPVAAVVVVLAIGVSVLQQQNGGVFTGQNDKAAPASGAPALSSGGVADMERSAGDQADRYDVVLIARAETAHNGFQEFYVLRVLRGEAPAELRLRVTTRPAETGRLHILYLSPLANAAGGESSTPGDGSPSPAAGTVDESLAIGPSAGAFAQDDQLLFGDGGDTVLAVRLPIGVNPDDVTMP